VQPPRAPQIPRGKPVKFKHCLGNGWENRQCVSPRYPMRQYVAPGLPLLPRRHLRGPRWRTSQAQLPDPAIQRRCRRTHGSHDHGSVLRVDHVAARSAKRSQDRCRWCRRIGAVRGRRRAPSCTAEVGRQRYADDRVVAIGLVRSGAGRTTNAIVRTGQAGRFRLGELATPRRGRQTGTALLLSESGPLAERGGFQLAVTH